MLFKDITLIDENFDSKTHMYVGVIGDKIEYIGDKMPENVADFGRIYEGKNKILMNGLFNAHSHSPMTLLRGYAEGYNLQDWLYNHIFPFEGKLNNDDCYWGSILAHAEMIRTGTVSVTDMYGHTEFCIKGAIDSGIKLNMTNGLMAFDETPFPENKNHLEEEELYKTYNGAENGRIKVEKSCHSLYTSNLNTVKALAEFCKENNRSVHIHLSETKTEFDECVEKYGKTPVEYFYDAGLFDSHTIAAHSVWLTDSDMDIMAQKKVVAVHNPISNLKLASGIADVPKMLKKGVIVSLGTDGCSSNNNLDMFEEIKLSAILHKGNSLDPLAVSAKDALKFATENGAYAQQRADCGKIKVGNKADLIVIDGDNPSMKPMFDAVNQVTFSACGKDTELTMVDGKILFEKGEFKTIDIEKAIYMAEKSKNRILQELKA